MLCMLPQKEFRQRLGMGPLDLVTLWVSLSGKVPFQRVAVQRKESNRRGL